MLSFLLLFCQMIIIVWHFWAVLVTFGHLNLSVLLVASVVAAWRSIHDNILNFHLVALAAFRYFRVLGCFVANEGILKLYWVALIILFRVLLFAIGQKRQMIVAAKI